MTDTWGAYAETQKIKPEPCEHNIKTWLRDCKPCRAKLLTPAALDFLDLAANAFPDAWVFDRPRGRYALIVANRALLVRARRDYNGASLRQLHAHGIVTWGPDRLDFEAWGPLHFTRHDDRTDHAERVGLTPAGRYALGKLPESMEKDG